MSPALPHLEHRNSGSGDAGSELAGPAPAEGGGENNCQIIDGSIFERTTVLVERVGKAPVLE